MHLYEAQTKLWLEQSEHPQTNKEALGRLGETIQACLKSFDADQWVQTQALLEESLAQTLIAMRMLGIHPERSIERTVARMKQTGNKQAFHIFADRVEICVGSESRGGWPLFSTDDLQQTLQVAQELGCEVIYHDVDQLNVFNNLTQEAPCPSA